VTPEVVIHPKAVIRQRPHQPLTWYVVGLAAFGIVFVLWAIFVALAAPQVREREVPLELTAVSEGTSFVRLSAREVIVRVDAAGGIRAGATATTVDGLQDLLSRLAAQGAGVSVTVRADARTPYSVIARVLAATRKSGIRDASLLLVTPPSARK